MFYHIRLDKIFHAGSTDMDARQEWDFRSLNKALAMIKRDYGASALSWRIQDLTERTSDLMTLESQLKTAIDSTYQFVVLTFKDGVPEARDYDHFEFFVSERDESEYAPSFAYSEEDELAISAPETIFEPERIDKMNYQEFAEELKRKFAAFEPKKTAMPFNVLDEMHANENAHTRILARLLQEPEVCKSFIEYVAAKRSDLATALLPYSEKDFCVSCQTGYVDIRMTYGD